MTTTPDPAAAFHAIAEAAALVFLEIADTVSLTCSEAERAAALIYATHGADAATDFLDCHVGDDTDEDDTHRNMTRDQTAAIVAGF